MAWRVAVQYAGRSENTITAPLRNPNLTQPGGMITGLALGVEVEPRLLVLCKLEVVHLPAADHRDAEPPEHLAVRRVRPPGHEGAASKH